MKKKGQNLVEYLLIAMLIGLACVVVVTKFNLVKIRNYVFMQPVDSTDTTKIKIEAMTD